MSAKDISAGTIHALPLDLRQTLAGDKEALEKWDDITPLARNEWICWTISVKQTKTRKEHIKRVVSELKDGKRRPCCWIGCIHRKDKSISKSVQGILKGRSKNNN
jgi:hypothetical protein